MFVQLAVAGLLLAGGWFLGKKSAEDKSTMPAGGYDLQTGCADTMKVYLASIKDPTVNKWLSDAIASGDRLVLEQAAVMVEGTNPSLAYCIRSFKKG